jgi:hypothetical protein
VNEEKVTWNNIILRCDGSAAEYPKVLVRNSGSLLIADSKNCVEYIQPFADEEEKTMLKNHIGFYTKLDMEPYFQRAMYKFNVPLATKYKTMTLYVDLYTIKDGIFDRTKNLDAKGIEVLSEFASNVLDKLNAELLQSVPEPEIPDNQEDIERAKRRMDAYSEYSFFDSLLALLHIRSEKETIDKIVKRKEEEYNRAKEMEANKLLMNSHIPLLERLSKINLKEIVMEVFKDSIAIRCKENKDLAKLFKDIFIVLSIHRHSDDAPRTTIALPMPPPVTVCH